MGNGKEPVLEKRSTAEPRLKVRMVLAVPSVGSRGLVYPSLTSRLTQAIDIEIAK